MSDSGTLAELACLKHDGTQYCAPLGRSPRFIAVVRPDRDGEYELWWALFVLNKKRELQQLEFIVAPV
jgi:hypothetical protein